MYPFLRAVQRIAPRVALLQVPNIKNSVNSLHILARTHEQQSLARSLLVPTSVSVTSNCGFKVKGFLKKRCKDCYFVRRQDRLYIICETHPRHKQMQVAKREKNTWILSHATQGKIRPW